MLQDESRVQTVYSLRHAVANAYGVDVSQVVGKDLSKEPLYQVTMDNPWRLSPTATGDERVASYRKSLSELPILTRDLLATHFGLVVKRERRQMDGYVLTIGSGGSKLDQDSDAPSWKEGAGYSQGEIFATTRGSHKSDCEICLMANVPGSGGRSDRTYGHLRLQIDMATILARRNS